MNNRNIAPLLKKQFVVDVHTKYKDELPKGEYIWANGDGNWLMNLINKYCVLTTPKLGALLTPVGKFSFNKINILQWIGVIYMSFTCIDSIKCMKIVSKLDLPLPLGVDRAYAESQIFYVSLLIIVAFRVLYTSIYFTNPMRWIFHNTKIYKIFRVFDIFYFISFMAIFFGGDYIICKLSGVNYPATFSFLSRISINNMIFLMINVGFIAYHVYISQLKKTFDTLREVYNQRI